jgi:hypothetical protein
MKTLIIIIIVSFFLSCSHKLQISGNQKSVIEIINAVHQKKAGIKKESAFSSNDERVYEIRRKAAQLYNIETDTSKIYQFIVWDVVSFGGGNIYGEMIIDSSNEYRYTGSYRTGAGVEKFKDLIFPGKTDSIIVNYLKAHRFTELEALANKKGKTLSGSNFFYLGMYEKGMDSVYVKLIPAFIIN